MDVHPVVQIAGIVALLIIVVYAIFKKVPISMRGGPVHLDLALNRQMSEIKEQVTAINKAVNGVPKDTPPLVDRVQHVEALSHWSASAIHSIANHVGLHLSEPPDRRTKLDQAEGDKA